MTYTIYLLLGFIFGMIVGFGLAKTIVDETIKKAWLELIVNAPKVNSAKKNEKE